MHSDRGNTRAERRQSLGYTGSSGADFLLIDLHTHTNESDGTYGAAELVDAAVAAGLEALAITDHDTLAGYDARGAAGARGRDSIWSAASSSPRNFTAARCICWDIL